MVNGEQTELLLNLACYIRYKFANEKIIGVTPGTLPFPGFLQKSPLVRGVWPLAIEWLCSQMLILGGFYRVLTWT